jgi:glycine cleavage system H protein
LGIRTSTFVIPGDRFVSATPTDRKYSRTHEWFKAEGDVVTIGITQYAADELSDVTYVALPEKGRAIAPGSSFGEVESVKATSELFSAVGGEVVETNAALADRPELVNNDPFGEGWMVKLRARDLGPLGGLLDASAYDGLIGT